MGERAEDLCTRVKRGADVIDCLYDRLSAVDASTWGDLNEKTTARRLSAIQFWADFLGVGTRAQAEQAGGVAVTRHHTAAAVIERRVRDGQQTRARRALLHRASSQ